MKPDRPPSRGYRAERVAWLAGVCLQAALLAALLVLGAACLLSYAGGDVVFRYQGF